LAQGQDEDRVDEFDRAPTTAEARVTGIGRETVAKANADDDDDAEDGNIDNVTSAFFAFARDPARKSLTNNVAMLRWLDAQERLQDRYEDELVRRRQTSFNHNKSIRYPRVLVRVVPHVAKIEPRSQTNHKTTLGEKVASLNAFYSCIRIIDQVITRSYVYQTHPRPTISPQI
jgi:hypothetical protein